MTLEWLTPINAWWNEMSGPAATDAAHRHDCAAGLNRQNAAATNHRLIAQARGRAHGRPRSRSTRSNAGARISLPRDRGQRRHHHDAGFGRARRLAGPNFWARPVWWGWRWALVPKAWSRISSPVSFCCWRTKSAKGTWSKWLDTPAPSKKSLCVLCADAITRLRRQRSLRAQWANHQRHQHDARLWQRAV